MAKWVFLNNAFIEEEKAFIHFKDLTFQRGYGVFDFFRLMGNRPLFLDDHIERFYASAENMHLPVPVDKESLKALVSTLIEKNNLPDSGIRISLTGGPSADGFSIGAPTILLSQHSFTLPSPEKLTHGITLFTYAYQRPLPHIKSIDYSMAIWLQPQQVQRGADDVLYVANNCISECPRSNFFLFTADNKLVTPADNILAGITRKKVLEIARHYLTVEERPVTLKELHTAKEAFITSTTKKIQPVAQINDIRFLQNTEALKLLNLLDNRCKIHNTTAAV